MVLALKSCRAHPAGALPSRGVLLCAAGVSPWAPLALREGCPCGAVRAVKALQLLGRETSGFRGVSLPLLLGSPTGLEVSAGWLWGFSELGAQSQQGSGDAALGLLSALAGADKVPKALGSVPRSLARVGAVPAALGDAFLDPASACVSSVLLLETERKARLLESSCTPRLVGKHLCPFWSSPSVKDTVSQHPGPFSCVLVCQLWSF